MSDSAIENVPLSINGDAVLSLSDGELAALAAAGCALPPMPRPIDLTATDVPSLRARSMVDDDGQVVGWFQRMWQFIVAPTTYVAVEAGLTGGTAKLWQYTANDAGFAEHVQGAEGAVFMLGSLPQLFGRILLSAGVTFYSTHPELRGVDPLPHATRTGTVLTLRTSGQPPRSFGFRFEGDVLLADDGPVTAADLVARISGFLGGGG